MKIVIVNKHPKDHLGGSEIQCDIIAKGLFSRGHDVVYLAIDGVGDYNTVYKVQIVDHSSKAISLAVNDIAPDIVYWRTYRYLSKGLELLINKFPVVYAVSSKYDLEPRFAFTVFKSKKRALKEYLILLRQYYIIKKAKGVTVLNPEYLHLVPHSFKKVILNAMERKVIPFEWPRPFCIWVANLRDTKRPEIYVSLAEKLQGNGIDFLMVGRTGKDYQWITDDKETPGNFYFLGEKTIEEVNGILERSMFHIHTCHPEGFGNIFIQAWLSGKPSISLGFDPGGFIESEGLGINAHNDIDLFANEVKKLIENKDVREKYGTTALTFASQNFTPESLVSNLEGFLIEVIGKK